jgi:hypothetical protein
VGCAQKADAHMKDFLRELKKKVTIATVGGSDFHKAKEQMGDDSESTPLSPL